MIIRRRRGATPDDALRTPEGDLILTRRGYPITEREIRAWVLEAERGYDPAELTRKTPVSQSNPLATCRRCGVTGHRASQCLDVPAEYREVNLILEVGNCLMPKSWSPTLKFAIVALVGGSMVGLMVTILLLELIVLLS